MHLRVIENVRSADRPTDRPTDRPIVNVQNGKNTKKELMTVIIMAKLIRVHCTVKLIVNVNDANRIASSSYFIILFFFLLSSSSIAKGTQFLVV